jgi:arginase
MEPALLYMDGGVDLFAPATNSTGILDSMGVAHLLDEPGAASELAGLGQARPLLRDDRLLLFGYTDYPGAEQDVLVRRVLLHLDVDVVDFIDLPIADIPQHNAGLTFDEAMTCLAVFAGTRAWPA